MSDSYYLKTKKQIPLRNIKQNLEREGIIIRDYGNDRFYAFVEGRSTRGVDFGPEKKGFEVRKVALANKADFEIMDSFFSQAMLLLDDAKIIDWEKKAVNVELFSDTQWIYDSFCRDIHILTLLMKNGKDIQSFGPHRGNCFGPRMYKEQIEGKNLDEDILCAYFEKLIQMTNYDFPEFGYGNVMKIGDNGAKPRIAKLLTNHNCFLAKYDVLLVPNTMGDEMPCMITYDILFDNLPQTWQRIDEFQAIVRELHLGKYREFQEMAKRNDCFEDFFGKTS
ncbi:hypothetical protein POV26_12175 [Aequorivita todarodis]|uniref:hypothetical protein n=1 Tax=Aequorivita todarodis TaxID=2036821 RepID=UPI0023501019|nr:hypothetical protein [Aequorivita todarodis]MDC8001796.1 hypothetical protein [Aequorivita todarodis]